METLLTLRKHQQAPSRVPKHWKALVSDGDFAEPQEALASTWSSGSHPGTRNDLTMSTLDSLLSKLRNGTFFPEVTYKLRDEYGVETDKQGLYAITDGGFHKWRICQFPDKVTSDQWRLRWSKRLESVRKDAECFFGRLKARFASLEHGPRTQNLNRFDDVVFACFMLHFVT